MLAADAIDARQARLRRWLGAGVLVFATHFAGGTLALVQWPEPDSDLEPTGAIVMELAALAVAPMDPQDLAIGPQSEDAVPTPQPTEQAVQEEIEELPPVEEAPLAPEPEVLMPKKVETAEKAEDEPELLKTQQQVTEVSPAASVATAPPKVDATQAPTVKARDAGVTRKPSQAEVTWQKALLLHLNRHKRYPANARSRRVQGVAKVEFKIDGEGKLVEARLADGSGSELLDAEALEVLQRASPFPAPPTPSEAGTLHLALPIEFRIR
jgi:protein TonB